MSKQYNTRKKQNSSRWVNISIAILCVIIILVFVIVLITKTGVEEIQQTSTSASTDAETTTSTTTMEITTESPSLLTYPTDAEDLFTLTENNITSEYAILLNVEDNTVMASRNADEIIYPASMTKIMTLLVAAENIEDMDDTFTMTYEIIAPLVEMDASRAGFSEGETVTLWDLMYGIALPSGADASVAIATYVSGSEEAFVELMNEKAEELGLENTHFVNTSGLHDEDHYSTVTDIALLMTAVMENDICQEVLSTYQYTTTATDEHPDGIVLESTMFTRMSGDEVEGITIEAGKTGYTDASGHCLVSYATDEEGNGYVAVVANSTTYWNSVYDTFAIYGLICDGYEMPTDLASSTSGDESITDETTYTETTTTY